MGFWKYISLSSSGVVVGGGSEREVRQMRVFAEFLYRELGGAARHDVFGELGGTARERRGTPPRVTGLLRSPQGYRKDEHVLRTRSERAH